MIKLISFVSKLFDHVSFFVYSVEFIFLNIGQKEMQ